MHHVRNVLAGTSGRSRGQLGQNEVNNTTISLHLSRSLYCLLVASRATLRVIHSCYFRISASLGCKKNLPPTTWQAANASIARGSHLQPAKSPNLSKRPILFLSLLGPSSSCIEALQGVPQMVGSSCSPTFDAQYQPACSICWEHIQTPSNEC